MTSSSLRAAVFLCVLALAAGAIVKRSLDDGSAMKMVCERNIDVDCARPVENAQSCTVEVVNVPIATTFETGCSTFGRDLPYDSQAISKMALGTYKYYHCSCARVVGRGGYQCSCQYTEEQYQELLHEAQN
ncbi:uncharacterized protein LOC101859501 [Aplysia californica]|uniref:Uncharacterized protein LOC101859501 n=1 Tax=Aplysia californica TaxID=6500 RepID=A0ABM0JYN9_APLCA|nr:uncharacterized protein LOC101859501 [Aplysia californica]